MTPEELRELAREVMSGKCRSYVEAARLFAEHVMRSGDLSLRPEVAAQKDDSCTQVPLFPSNVEFVKYAAIGGGGEKRP